MNLLIPFVFFILGCIFGCVLNVYIIHIPIGYSFVTGIAFLLIACQYSISLQSILLCMFACCLVADAYIDFHTMELPDGITLAILALGLIRLFSFPLERPSLLFGAFVISVPLFLLALFTDGFGGGDIKLCAVCGLFLGYKAVLLGFLIGCVTGALYAIILILRHKADRKTIFALGPFLCLGFFIASLCTNAILTLYPSFF